MSEREWGGDGSCLHFSETRNIEVMLGDGNRSRNRGTAKIFPVTQPLTVRRSTQMKQSNRAKWSGWQTLIGITRSIWRHLRPPPPQLFGFNKEWRGDAGGWGG